MMIFVAIFLSGTVYHDSIVPVSAATVTPRADTVWTTGYWMSAGSSWDAMLPWAGNPGFGASYFYDSLFGWNSYTDEYIPCIGEDLLINTAGTQYIINIWDEAHWSGPGIIDGSVATENNLTADDVVFTFNYLNATKWGNFFERIDSIIATTNKQVVITLKPAYAHSKALKDWLTSDIPILNKQVWLNISAEKGLSTTIPYERPDINQFWNRWDYSDPLDVNSGPYACPVEWQVSSGPYMQTGEFGDIDSSHEVYKRNDDWWGNGILYRDIMGPATAKATGSADKTENVHPAFVGIKFYPGKDAAILAIQAGEIDQSAIGLPDYKDLTTTSEDPNDYLHTWYHDDDVRTYTAQGHSNELVFNTHRYPMSEHWFREAISKAIYYAPISTMAGGNNWIQGSPTYLNPKYNPEHLAIFDQEIHDDYKFEYNASAAKQIFTDAGAYQKFENGRLKWLIDAPAPASVPLATQYDDYSFIDADPDRAGTQMEIGPYSIITVMGWTDTTIAVDYWATSISASLDLQIIKKDVIYPTWDQQLNGLDFDLAMWPSGLATINSPYRMFNSLVEGHSAYGNVSSWRGANAATFAAALAEYETADSSLAEQIAASNLQRAYAQDIPTISTHIDNFWYQYSTQYWKGWNNDGWQYNQPCTNYVTDQIVIKQRLVLALAPAASSWNPPANFDSQSSWQLGEEPWDGTPADITPTAVIFANQKTINQGQSIKFTYTGTFGNFPAQIHWDFGDGSEIVSNENPTHPFYTAGVHTTTVTVIDGDGDTSTATMDITVLAGDIPPIATFIANQTNITQDQSVAFAFTGIMGNLPAEIQWNFGDDTAIVTGTAPIHKFTDAGTFTVTLTVTDDDGDTMTATMTITVEESTTETTTTTTTTTSTTDTDNSSGIPGYPLEFLFLSGLLFIGYLLKKRKNRS